MAGSMVGALSNGRRFHRLISLATRWPAAVRDEVLEGCHHTNPRVERRRQSRVARSPGYVRGARRRKLYVRIHLKERERLAGDRGWTLGEILRQQHQKVLAWKSLKPDTQLACVEASPGSKPSMPARLRTAVLAPIQALVRSSPSQRRYGIDASSVTTPA